MSERHRRLSEAQLYLVCDDRSDEFLRAALRGGVEIVQLRMKDASDEAILAAAQRFKRLCAEANALMILNDRPDLASAADVDGVHLGQEDIPPAQARRWLGAERLIGLSTHTPGQVDAAADVGVDYIGVGPVNETPTKPGRAAVGLELVRYAATCARVPFFAIGGISAVNVEAVLGAGARRIAVVRALTQADDPEAVAGRLSNSLTRRREVTVGAT